jgi:hypothetical protein
MREFRHQKADTRSSKIAVRSVKPSATMIDRSGGAVCTTIESRVFRNEQILVVRWGNQHVFHM